MARWRSRELWSSEPEFERVLAGLELVEEAFAGERIMRDRATGETWLWVLREARFGDRHGQRLCTLRSWPPQEPRRERGLLSRLLHREPPPPWERPRALWEHEAGARELRARLDEVIDRRREGFAVLRDRHTGQHWREESIEGGGDSFPGQLLRYTPIEPPALDED